MERWEPIRTVAVQELTDYKDDDLQISEDQISFGDKAYQIADIKSVRVSTQRERPEIWDRTWFRLLYAGLNILFAFSLLENIFHVLPADLHSNWEWVNILVLAFIVSSSLWYLRADWIYQVVLKGTFGKVNALSSKNVGYAVMVANTIRSAMKHYETK